MYFFSPKSFKTILNQTSMTVLDNVKPALYATEAPMQSCWLQEWPQPEVVFIPPPSSFSPWFQFKAGASGHTHILMIAAVRALWRRWQPPWNRLAASLWQLRCCRPLDEWEEKLARFVFDSTLVLTLHSLYLGVKWEAFDSEMHSSDFHSTLK